MKQILDAKLEQCSKFRDELSKSQGKRIIEATQDTYWASGLPPYLCRFLTKGRNSKFFKIDFLVNSN